MREFLFDFKKDFELSRSHGVVGLHTDEYAVHTLGGGDVEYVSVVGLELDRKNHQRSSFVRYEVNDA